MKDIKSNNSQIKEFFNNLIRQKELETKPLKKRKRRMIGMPNYYEYSLENLPSIEKFSSFINCEISPMVCPMVWEELSFIDDNRRYCQYCCKNIYRVDDIESYKEYSSKNECMALSIDVFEKIHSKLTKLEYENLEVRLKISRLFMVYRFIDENSTIVIDEPEDKMFKLKKIILSILMRSNFVETINQYLSHGVDMQYIFENICPKFNDSTFDLVLKNAINNIEYSLNMGKR